MDHPWNSLVSAALEVPDKVAVVDGSSKFTYQELHGRCSELGSFLQGHGVGQGSSVGVLLPNIHETIEVHFAAAWLGASVVNLNTRLVAHELAYILGDSLPSTVIVHQDLLDRAVDAMREAGQESSVKLLLVVRSGPGGVPRALLDDEVSCRKYEDAFGGGDLRGIFFGNKVDLGLASPYQVYYTSGTTGKPKRVILSMGIVCKHSGGAIDAMRINKSDVWGHFAPMFHLVDAFAIYSVTHVQGTHVMLESFDSVRTMQTMEREGVTISNVASTMVTLMVSSPWCQALDFTTLRILSCGGSPLVPATVKKAIGTFGCEFFLSYGMTECCGKISMSILSEEELRSLDVQSLLDLICTSGRPFSLMDVKVVTDAGTEAKPDSGEVGEVLCRGPTVFDGYANNPEANKEAFRDGWFRTGDLATVNGSGYITVIDRCKDMILCGGENVYCVEVEAALMEHPSVMQAAVFGVPNSVMGEMVTAAVRIQPGSSASERDLVRHCQKALSSYKVPSRILIVSEMPTTGSGKILKTELRKNYLASKGEGSATTFSLKDCKDLWEVVSHGGVEAEEGEAVILVECESEGDLAVALNLLAEHEEDRSTVIVYKGDAVQAETMRLLDALLGQVVIVHVSSVEFSDWFLLSLVIAGCAPAGEVEPKSEPESWKTLVSDIVAELTGASVGEGDPLMENGMTSATAIELSNRLGEKLSVSLPSTLVFDYGNISSISENLVALCGTQQAPGHHSEGTDAKLDSVKHIIQSFFDFALEPDQPFTDAGLNSSTAVQLMEEIKEEVDVELSATATFDYPTLNLLLGYISECDAADQVGPLAGGELDALPASGIQGDATTTVFVTCCDSKMPCSNTEGNFDSISTVPLSRWDWRDQLSKKVGANFGSFLSSIEDFDCQAFRIASNEARFMDPQQRMLLETTAVVMTESPAPLSTNSGVFVGISMLEYSRMNVAHNGLGTFSATSGHLSVTSGRLSYTFGMTGPSLTIDTACSSSLVGMHVAREHIAMSPGSSESSLFCGANLTLAREWTESCSLAGMLSSEGRCKTLDASADGYVRAEAALAFALHSDESGGHTIVAKASSVNQDGRSSSLTAPNGPSQQDIIRQVMARGGSLPEDAAVLQMHGTGTALGDPIEVGAALSAFSSSAGDACISLSSVKSNVGHAEPAAGAVGVLALCQDLNNFRGMCHLREMNAHVVATLKQHKNSVLSSREACNVYQGHGKTHHVSSFAFQGTNAHASFTSDAVSDGVVWKSSKARFHLLESTYLWSLPIAHPFLSFGASSGEPGHQIEVCFSVERQPFLWDHKVFNRCLFPGSGFFEMAFSSLLTSQNTRQGTKSPMGVQDLSIMLPCLLPQHTGFEFETLLSTRVDGNGYVTISSHNNVHCTAYARRELQVTDRPENAQTCSARISPDPSCSPLCSISYEGEPEDYFNMHPAISDAAIHFNAACKMTSKGKWGVKVPVATDYLSFGSKKAGVYYSGHNRVYSTGDNECHDHNIRRGGAQVLLATGLLLKEIGSRDALRSKSRKSKMMYTIRHLAFGPSASEPSVPFDSRSANLTVGSAHTFHSKAGAAPLWTYLAVLSIATRIASTNLSTSLRLETFSVLPSSKGGVTNAKKGWGGDGVFHWSMLRTMFKEYPQTTLEALDQDVYSTSTAKFGGTSVLGSSCRSNVLYSSILSDRLATNTLGADHEVRGSCLFTGGMGDIGLCSARWYQSRQGKSVVLVGRTLPSRRLPDLCSYTASLCDVSFSEDVAHPFAFSDIRSVVHAAGGLFDGLLRSQTVSSSRSCFQPKVEGLQRLVSLPLQPITSLVCFSSIASVVPTAGQANYSAANSFMDLLCDSLRMSGVPSTSIQWGGWRDLGMAARDKQVLQRLHRQGLGTLPTQEGLRVLNEVFVRQKLWLSGKSQILASPLEVSKVGAMFQREVLRVNDDNAAASTPAHAIAESATLLESIKKRVSKIVAQILDDDVEEDKSLIEMGIDSLGGMELQNRLTSDFGLQIPNTLIFDYPSIDDISKFIGGGVKSVQSHDVQPGIALTAETAAPRKPKEEDAQAQKVLQSILVHTEWPLTEEQLVFWTHFTLKPHSSCYNMNCVISLDTSIDVDILRSAYMSVLRKHPILRVVFSSDGSHFRVKPSSELVDLVVYEEEKGFSEAMSHPFDLVRGPITRIHVHGNNVLFITHHIVADWRSMGIIAEDVKTEYLERLQKRPDPPTSGGGGESDLLFIESTLRRNEVDPDDAKQNLDHWYNYLTEDRRGKFEILNLECDFKRQLSLHTAAGSIQIGVSVDLTQRLLKQASRQNLTLFNAVFGAWFLTLHMMANDVDDITLGTPFDLRSKSTQLSQIGSSIGCFSSILPVRAQITNSQSIVEFLRLLMTRTLDSFDHPDVPWLSLLKRLQPKRTIAGSNPLFTTCFSFLSQNYDNFSLPMPESAFDYWLALGKASNGSLVGMLTYDAHAFTRKTAQKTKVMLVRVLETLAYMPWEDTVLDLKLASRKESHRPSKIHIMPQATQVDHPWNSLVSAALEVPDKVAVVDGSSKFTYQELHGRCSELGSFLQGHGVGQGSSVGVLLPNIHETIEVHFAAAWLGASVVNLNTRLVAHELAYILGDSLPSTVIVHQDLLDRAVDAMREAGQESSVKLLLVVRSGPGGVPRALLDDEVSCRKYEDAFGGGDLRGIFFGNKVDLGLASPYQVYYTSGTTGKPKRVILSMGIVCKHSGGAIDAMRINKSDVWGHFAPMFHLVDAFAIYSVTHVQGTHVMLESFDSVRTMQTMEREGVTISNVASTMVTLMVSSPWCQALDFTTLRILSCGGSPLVPATVKKAIGTFGCEFFLSYGMTECCGKISMSILSEEELRSLDVQSLLDLICTSGRPFSLMDVKVVTDAGTEAKPDSGEVGEVLCRGPTVFDGYANNPEANKEAFRDGWFRTGDLATVNGSGYITVIDRCKDMILCGGENVYCVEVEAALMEHPSVMQAAVFGVPNSVMGEMVTAAVRIQPGSSASERDLVRHCQKALSSYKVPSRILIVSEMPTTGSGKILKTELRKNYLASKGEGGATTFSLKDCKDLWEVVSHGGVEAEEGEAVILVECESEGDLAVALNLLAEYDVDGIFVCCVVGNSAENDFGMSSLFVLESIASMPDLSVKLEMPAVSQSHASPDILKTILLDCISQSVNIEDTSQSVWDAGMTSMLAVKNMVDNIDALVEPSDAIFAVPYAVWDSEVLMERYGSIPRFGNFMKDVYNFDRLLYNMSATEASMMDPQHRILVQHATNVLNGLSDDMLSQCSCYVGISQMDHFAMTKVLLQRVDAYMGTDAIWTRAKNPYFLESI
ncbi:polyketide synthase [Chloropicon primus]|uniref:Polyketide synthase n=1 Tax=Chloropicon primus TaxID=1764295 RepID=A0A5B8MLV1_9CHLO|nr:polyketide synthase [Chloropicon primus]|eukprot:QDZ21473.1 polyketide synthase [Chloropicon primus]